ncbi:hypothetical protein HMPREF0731_1670 [Pseudoroseomonas cervicalis ATCC 49957]|uniref:Uncharacterized protein n=1 Tax=Pseudoroseomonas cervicalis ATCC 49957 TaxID=525371 RepID=D5RKR0_9PROT|nr:hypothetical protein HMPREF0731_1670 [Pseudoroseomonas cervicalis ATCC 49957]
MTKDRKRGRPAALEMPLSDSVSNLLQKKPKEISDAHQSVRERQEKVRQHVEEGRAEIKRGARPPGKPFRL